MYCLVLSGMLRLDFDKMCQIISEHTALNACEMKFVSVGTIKSTGI